MPTIYNRKQEAPYKVYVANITQSGTDAPVATVLENTAGGTVVWSRLNSGRYLGTLAGAFPDLTTIVPNSLDVDASGFTAFPITDTNDIIGYYSLGTSGDGNALYLQVFNDSFVYTDLGTLVNSGGDVLGRLCIDVKMYL